MKLIKSIKSSLKRRIKQVVCGASKAEDQRIFADYHALGSYEEPRARETAFITTDGREIPVYSDYRYRIKPGWKYFREMALLDQLCARGFGSEQDRQFLNAVAGSRTLTAELSTVRSRLNHLLIKYPELFIKQEIDNIQVPVLKPSAAEIESRVSSLAQYHRNILADLQARGIYSHSPGDRMLEIGFISGGYSIFAFERLGFKAFGVDNYYGGLTSQPPLPGYASEILGSRAGFHNGDITRRTPFEDNSFNLIFSASVLEHVQNLPAAFAELRRLLAPGGVMVHSYHPFYCENGGHALGILDSPWAHVRLNRDDYLRYVGQFRPYECPEAEHWIRDALNPTPMNMMQKCLTDAGLDIRHWKAGMSKPGLLGLEQDIIKEAMEQHEGITLHDLTCNNVFFAATSI
jgi:SAM-dependent methyltransferase